jgi:apolipoprotein N-acyltransferase
LARRRRSPPSNSFVLSARAADAVALVAGLLLPLAFAPFDLIPLALLAPAALFWLWREGSAARAAWRGFLFGLGLFGVGVSWVYVSLHNFGNMPVPLAAFATFLFVTILALYLALLGFVQARWFDRARWTHAVFVLPSLWVLCEWWRSWFLSGFPWLNLGYSQSQTWLAYYAPLAGVYGVSLAVAAMAGLLVACVAAPRRAPLYVGALAALWLGGLGAGQIDWAEADGAPLTATLVQANVPLREKWNPSERGRILERYRELSFAAPASQLIVWPEAAVPASLHQLDPEYVASLRKFAAARGTDFMIGVIEGGEHRREFYNSVVVIGAGAGVYRKQHLVPFGEYTPFAPFFQWLMRSFDIPMSNLSPAPGPQATLAVVGRQAGVSVCYEDAFGEELIRALPQAALLVNVSEDAWFGDSLAPHQRLQMAQLRALETARPMLRAANTGPSAAIDHRGRLLASSPQFQPYLLHAQIQPMRGATPYSRGGNWPVVVFAALLALAAWAVGRRR